jgi:aspartate 1-decarboxylase
LRIEVLKSKIHRAKITQAELHYVGSISIDEDLMDAANLIEGEKVTVVNINNGERLETYVIKGERGSGMVCMNGRGDRPARPPPEGARSVGWQSPATEYCWQWRRRRP